MRPVLFLLFILAELNHSAVFAANSSCHLPTNQSNQISSLLSLDILKQADIRALKAANSDFCHRNMLMRYIDVKKAAPTNCESLSTSQLEALVDKINVETNPWQLTLVSTQKAKLRATVAGIAKIKNTKNDPVNYFSVAARQRPQAWYQSVTNKLNSLGANKAVQSSTNNVFVRTAACATEILGSIFSCQNAIDKIAQKMTPTAEGDLTDINLWKRVVGSPKMDQGLRLMALQLAQAIKDNNFTHVDNIFSDLQNNFVKSGLSKADAYNSTWDFLGLMANHGPDTGIAVNFVENGSYDDALKSQKASAIQYIASAMTYIDYMRLKSGKAMYSYPKNIRSSCDNSKPYHFWMSAYLARSLVLEEKMNPLVAAKSTFLAEKGYQVNRNAVGGGAQSGVARLFHERLYSPSHEIVRTDLAYSSAGALFGAKSAQSLSSAELNVNSALVALEQQSGIVNFAPGEASGLGKVESYMKWTEIFQPNVAFDALAKGFKN